MKNYGNTSDSKDIQTIESVKELIKQSDWNQNDETQLDYIKNRICYKEEIEPETIAIIDTEIISAVGSYCFKGASFLNNSYYYGVILPKGVKKEYGVEKTIEISNGIETFEVKYTLQPGYSGGLVCPSGFQGGGGWYDNTFIGLPEVLKNYDFVISFSCSNVYEGFTVKQFETTSSTNVNKIDVEYNSEGLGGIREVEPEVLIDADLGGNFNWPKKLNVGDICLISYDAPWSSAPNKYQITGKSVAYSEGGQIKLPFEGYSKTSYLTYNIYPNPSTTGTVCGWSGHFKVVKIGELTKIDNNLLSIPSQQQADWNQENYDSVDYIKNKPTIGNGTLTIKQGNTILGTFKANNTTNNTIIIPAPIAQVQADWEQNDDNQSDYIKNRTHYINRDCEAIDSYSVIEFPSYWKEPPESIYQENAYYRISFNWYNYLESKQEYYSGIFQLTRKYSSDQTIVHPYLCCGNMGLNYSGFPDTGEPFNFCAEINTDVDDRLEVRRIRIDIDHYPNPTNVLIERIDPFVKLDENFIPDTISKKINIQNLTISVRGVEYKLSDIITALIDANVLNN